MSAPTPLDRLAGMGLTLPPLPPLGGRYQPWTRAGDIVYLAGVASPTVRGRAGESVDVASAAGAAEGCALLLIAVLVAALGSLDRVGQILKVTGFVACPPDFPSVPNVIDGASGLLIVVFGDRGRHARTAIGVSALPGGAPVEVEMVVQAGPA